MGSENLEVYSTRHSDGAYGEHTFVECSYPVEIEIDAETYHASFQTGHSYDHNDYNYPTNSVDLYDDDGFLSQLYRSDDYDEFDEDDGNDYISEKDYNLAMEDLRDLRIDAQNAVTEHLAEVEEEIKNDDHYYIQIQEFEVLDNVDDDGNVVEHKNAESPVYSMRFESEEEMQEVIDSMNTFGNYASSITAKEGRRLHDEGYSNF
ncbi:hypothetical protein DRO61_05500 [Candidatus Bathyarchaeota archaeon]|nr:MAG: hypothetical protein DRO61_05500 [Candidatus Bathyarchaeota archaeon]